MKEGLVSIITPTYNSEQFIVQTIQSVQAQSYTNWEMIIVDDCSTDATFKILQQQATLDSRIKIQKSESNSGAGIARQKAIVMAKGQYIAFLDSDDLWKPTKLQSQLYFMQTKNLAVTYCFYELMDEEGKLLNEIVKSPNTIDFKKMFYSNWIGNLTGIYDASKLGKVSISSFRKRQDWIMWLNVIKDQPEVFVLPENLAIYRVRKDSISSSKIKLLKSNFLVYKSFHGQNYFKACISMSIFLYTHFIIKKRYRVKYS